MRVPEVIEIPEIRYAQSGEVKIAYQTVGEGPIDLIPVSGSLTNIVLDWEEPQWATFHRKLAEFARLIVFDRRGVGVSDRAATISLEERMDDVRAVMDAAGSARAALFGLGDGGAMLALFAATYPERAAALVLHDTEPRWTWAPDYPWGMKPEEVRSWLEEGERGLTDVGVYDRWLREGGPSMYSEELVRWLFRWRKLSSSPEAWDALQRTRLETDIRHVLPTIRVPTLVLSRTNDRVFNAEVSRYVADQIPTARYLELPGTDHWPWGDDADAMIAAIREFLGEVAEEEPGAGVDRVLVTILFTDIVGSTERAADLGDARWRELLQDHHRLIRRQLARFRGKEIDTAGDGFFASFDGPARAIRCARAISESVKELGLDVRAGLHTGECELLDSKVGGIAVHIGSRVAAKAGPGEVLVSGTVRDLVAGSGLEFEDRGAVELKGVPGEWRLYAVAGS